MVGGGLGKEGSEGVKKVAERRQDGGDPGGNIIKLGRRVILLALVITPFGP